MSDSLQHITPSEGQIVLYHPNETISLEVKLEQDTVWLTQAQMVQLFDSSKANISEHISNIYEQGELTKDATVRNFRTVRKEGNRLVTRSIDYYNLDMIISAISSHKKNFPPPAACGTYTPLLPKLDKIMTHES